jgi:serine/threonine-protein phosphatase 5
VRKKIKKLRNLRIKVTSILRVRIILSYDIFPDFAYEKSIDMYTEAIFCKISPIKKSIYFCNRALANLKLENYGVALLDACESVKHDKTNVKGYYRRAQAYYALR